METGAVGVERGVVQEEETVALDELRETHRIFAWCQCGRAYFRENIPAYCIPTLPGQWVSKVAMPDFIKKQQDRRILPYQCDQCKAARH